MSARNRSKPAESTPWTVAAIQMTSSADVRRNVARAKALMREANAVCPRLIALPENFAYLRREGVRVTRAMTLDGEVVSSMRREAIELGCFVLLGSIPEKVPRSRRTCNTSVLIDPQGEIVATYRKMHLFDIAIRGRAVLQESRWVTPGQRPVVVETELGRLGLSICYDLRFPELYRQMTFAGADVLFVPAAFTAFTGPHHWLPLLRARAIENQCWVVAPAQVGRHGPGRESHGESVIIDPWGTVQAMLRDGEGWIHGQIDPARLAEVRSGLPCLDHVRRELWHRRF